VKSARRRENYLARNKEISVIYREERKSIAKEEDIIKRNL